jgi:hypothetical protein
LLVLGLLNELQDFEVRVYPVDDWSSSEIVEIEVAWNGIRQPETQNRLPKMKWLQAYQAFATRLDVNEHQLAAMAQGLERGHVLRFDLNCRRSDLESVGFIAGR